MPQKTLPFIYYLNMMKSLQKGILKYFIKATKETVHTLFIRKLFHFLSTNNFFNSWFPKKKIEEKKKSNPTYVKRKFITCVDHKLPTTRGVFLCNV